MSVRARIVERALSRMSAPNALLTRDRTGVYGVFPSGDRRRRPICRLSAAEVRDLSAAGAIAALEGEAESFVLTDAGRARVRREASPPEDAFQQQHREIVERTVIDSEGDLRRARGFDATAPLKRLGMLRDANGAPFLAPEELAAAARLRADWEASQIGLVRGSDWSAAPKGGAARGPGSALEGALAAHCDARRRVSEALEELAPPLRRVVERVCCKEEGLATVERAERWPERSGKIALKLGLAQLARHAGRRS